MKRLSVMVLLLILVAFGLRVWNLSSQSVWWDEAYTVQTARYDWATFWQLQSIARHPPLYFLTVEVWGSLAGWSEFSLRFLSVAYGLIAVALVYQLARRLIDRRAGFAALAVAAVSPALIVYAQEGRMYALVFMLAAATLYFGFRIFDFEAWPDQLRLESMPFVLCEALLLLTHYFALPFVTAINLLALGNFFYHRARLSMYLRWMGGQVLAALPVVIWVTVLGLAQGGLAAANEPRPDLLSFVYQTGILWGTGIRDLQGRWSLLFVALLGLTMLIAIGVWLHHRRRARSLIVFSGVSIACAFLFACILTSFHPRYVLLFGLPAYVLAGAALTNVVVAGISSRRRLIGQRIASGAMVVLLAVSVIAGWSIAADPQYAKDDARSVAAYLKAHASADDVILFEDNDYTLSYYDHGPASIKMISAQTEADALQQMSDAIGDAQYVWLAHWKVSTQDPRDYWRFLLEQSGRMTDWTSYRGYELYRYEMQSPLHAPTVDIDGPPVQGSAYFDKWSGIAGQGTDGALTFAIHWQLGRNVYRGGEVSVRLKNEAGITISSVDVPLLNEYGKSIVLTDSIQTAINYYVLPIPPGTPPLTYTLSALIYVAESAQTAQEFDIISMEKTLGMIGLPRRLDTSDPYRALAAYKWQSPAVPEVAPNLLLDFVVGNLSPGSLAQVDITLRWRTIGPAAHIEPKLRLVQNGRVWDEVGSNLFERDYPVEQWAEGELVIDRRRITYPPIRGPMELQVGQGDQWTTLTTLQLNDQWMSFTPPAMQHTQSTQFGQFAELVGFDLDRDSLSLSQSMSVKLYWRATSTEPITTAYTAFTQLLAPDGHLVAQHDTPPRPPTTQWVPGQVVEDVHTIEIVDPTYRGPATLIVGWYNSATVQRVPVQGGGDYVTLQTPIQVKDK